MRAVVNSWAARRPVRAGHLSSLTLLVPLVLGTMAGWSPLAASAQSVGNSSGDAESSENTSTTSDPGSSKGSESTGAGESNGTAEARANPELTARQLQRRRADIAQRMSRLEQIASSVGATADQPTAIVAANELKLLRTLDMLYLHLQTALSQDQETSQQRDQYREERMAMAASPSAQGPPPSWLTWEDCRDRLDAETARVRSRSQDVDSARDALEAAAAEHAHVERRRRQVISDAALADGEERTKHEYRRRMADLEATVASSTVELRRTELRLRRRQLECADEHRQLLAAQVERMKPRVVFSNADFALRQKELVAYFASITERVEKAQKRLRAIDAWATRNAEPTAAAEHPNDRSDASGELLSDEDSQLSTLSHATLHFLRSICHEELLELERREGDAQMVRDSAVGRFKLHSGRMTELEIAEWRDTCERFDSQLEAEERRLTNRVSDLLQDLTTLHRESRLRSSGGTMPLGDQEVAAKQEANRDVRPAAFDQADVVPSVKQEGASSLGELQARGAQLESLLRTLEFSQRHLLAIRRALHRFQSDLQERLPKDRGQSSWSSLAQGAATLWNYELMAVGDQSITVDKLTRGACGFVVGLVVAAVVSRMLGRRILPRVGLNRGASEALRTLSFYGLCLLFGILSLELAHVPLTAFTFLGGAVAIGVGFGSQNILNNFISGLILLAEQPIRAGDLVEVGDWQGTVERIGARSTTIRTGANAEIVVPNSKLLEENVTNLTRSDDRFRSSVQVGVAYGSPIDQVKRCLLEAADRPEVLSEPHPFVLFADFGESTLNFELHFWVRLASMTACRQVASDIRESIDSAFREAGIEMAFPQRDLHLTTNRPLELSLIRSHANRIHKAA